MFRGVRRGDRVSSRNYSNKSTNLNCNSSKNHSDYTPNNYPDHFSKSKKAQVAMEYLIMVGFVMLITVPLILIFYDYSGDSKNQINTNQVNAMGKKIIDAAESVYYMGAPSKITLKANFPEMIDSVTMENDEIVFKVRGPTGVSDIVLTSSVPIHGEIAGFEGVHNIQIEARSDGVWITE